MGKMKVHELAKELSMQSKELVEKLVELKYNVKNHMSILEERDIEKIKKQIKQGKISEKKDISDKKEVPLQKEVKKDKKPITPVIIRREVTRIEEDETQKPKAINRPQREDLGVVQRRTDASMNIKYRTPPRKIATITSNDSVEIPKNIENTSAQQKKLEENKTEKKVIEDEEAETLKKNIVEIKKEDEEKKFNNEKVVEEVPVASVEKVEVNKEESKKTYERSENKSYNDLNGYNRNNNRLYDNGNKDNNKAYDNRNRDNTGRPSYENRNRDNSRTYENRNKDNNGRIPYDNRSKDNNSRPPYENRTRDNNSRPPYENRNRDNNGRPPYENRNRNNNGRPPYENRNGDNNRTYDNRGDNRSYQQRRPNNQNFNRPGQSKENKLEKDIKGVIASSDVVQKEPAREIVRTGYKDKEKDSRKFEEATKKVSKSKVVREIDEDINIGKLKDLQSENHFSNMFNDTESKMFDYYDLSNRKKSFKKNKKKPVESHDHIEQKIFELKDIDIEEIITVKDLAEKLKKQSGEVIKKLMNYGILATVNNELDFDTAFLVSNEFGITAHKKEIVSDEDILFDDTDDNSEDLIPRPPVVVVMGHVDHGKTSLLDAIRSTNVSEREAGGITQHIGAYKVEINGREITFLDTPGHEAFTAMRARGAQVTDVAIIIVAADDGIMPQTVEAINHAKAAGVSIIVAINKIDKPGANVDKVKQELTEYGLVPEEWGGDAICVPISAKQHKNIDALLEMVLLVADMKDLKTNPNKQSKGTVLEARLDKNSGITASLLVQRGTLNIGDTIVVGSVIGKIRGMVDDKGQKVRAAGPSTPVEVIGLPEVPDAGEIFYEVENEKVAKHLIEKRKSKLREDMIRKSAPVTLDNLFNQIEEGKLKDLNVIIKADVQGSVQAIRQSLEKIQNAEARVRVIHANVGGITESDVTLAKVTNSIIIGFNVRPESIAKSTADKEGVEIKIYSVIYNAIDDVTAALNGMLQPKYKEVIQGTAEVRQVFKITNVGMIAGCYVLDGKIVRNSGLRVIRDNVVIHTGKLSSLKRMKDDAKDVATGYECGVQIENYSDIKVGDKIESYIMEVIKQN